jgi:hypothetical protein
MLSYFEFYFGSAYLHLSKFLGHKSCTLIQFSDNDKPVLFSNMLHNMDTGCSSKVSPKTKNKLLMHNGWLWSLCKICYSVGVSKSIQTLQDWLACVNPLFLNQTILSPRQQQILTSIPNWFYLTSWCWPLIPSNPSLFRTLIIIYIFNRAVQFVEISSFWKIIR